MAYFYNTLGVLGAVFLVKLIYDLWRFLVEICSTYLEYLSKESQKARKLVKDFKDINWYVVNTSQPPNNKMVTLHLKSLGKDELLETKVSIDKGKY